MKGDRGTAVACPRCGQLLHPIMRRKAHYYVTSRHMIRAALNQHFQVKHPDMTARERSLLADEAYEKCRTFADDAGGRVGQSL